MNPGTKVRSVMTPSPHTIGAEQTLATAHKMMRSIGIRHLPVLHGGKLVGMVTERDLHLIETLRETNIDEVKVEEAMTPEPFVADAESPLWEVARSMAAKRYGSAVVTEHGTVVGIFTAVDALYALSTALSPT